MAQLTYSTMFRLRRVLGETGDSRSWLYQRIADKQFPPPVKCGGISKWPAREVAAMNEAEIEDGPRPRKRSSSRTFSPSARQARRSTKHPATTRHRSRHRTHSGPHPW